MGSWNHTCMLSKMHVQAYGDHAKVVSLFLVENPKRGSGHCYNDYWFKPIPVLLYGDYNDYGAVEAFTGKFDHILVDYIQKNLVEVEQGENPYHDIPVEKEGLDLEKLYDADHEDRLFVKTWQGKSHVNHVVIKRDLFERILNEYSYEEHDWTNIDTFEGYHRWKVSYSDIVKNIAEDVRTIRQAFENDPLKEHRFALGTEMVMRPFMRQYGKGADNSKRMYLADWLPVRDSFSSGPIDIDFFSRMLEMDEETAIEFTREMVKFSWLNYYISGIREQWMPQSHQGSQAQETQGYALMGQYLLDSVAAEKREYDEENLDEEEVAA